MKEKVYCKLGFLRSVNEKTVSNADGSFKTLSITGTSAYEMMIFIERKNKQSDYAVKIYKCEPKNIFIPSIRDRFTRCNIGPLYDSFFFENFEDAKMFIINLGDNHREYERRPVTSSKR